MGLVCQPRQSGTAQDWALNVIQNSLEQPLQSLICPFESTQTAIPPSARFLTPHNASAPPHPVWLPPPSFLLPLEPLLATWCQWVSLTAPGKRAHKRIGKGNLNTMQCERMHQQKKLRVLRCGTSLCSHAGWGEGAGGRSGDRIKACTSVKNRQHTDGIWWNGHHYTIKKDY